MDTNIFKTEQQKLAYLLAKQAHKGQMYGTNDYFEYHVLGVVSMLRQLGYEGDYITVALLHDVVEDTKITEDVLNDLFTFDVVEAVSYLTKINSSNYSEETYLKGIKKSELAIKVKIADSTFNLFENVRNKDKQRAKKYTRYLTVLTT